MKLKTFSLCCFIPYFLLGCGSELDSLSGGGVSLGGTGLPSTGGTPPLTTDLEGLPNDDPFILWSGGTIEKTCDQINIKMQLINIETGSILGVQQGISLLPNPEANIGVVINVTNNNLETTTEYFENCQPFIQIIGQDGQQLQTNQTSNVQQTI